MKITKWDSTSILYMLLMWSAGIVSATGIGAWVLGYRIQAVIAVLAGLGVLLFTRLSMNSTPVYEEEEVQTFDISGVKEYMESIAKSSGKFYISVYTQGMPKFATLKFNSVLFRELYEMVRFMQADKVRVFITNEPAGLEISYGELKRLLVEEYKQYEHVLAMDEVLIETKQTSLVLLDFRQDCTAM